MRDIDPPHFGFFGPRRVSRAHRQLDVLRSRVVRALEAGHVHTARDLFDRVADALESRLALEESFLLRSVEALRPELSEAAETLRGDHASLRQKSSRVRMLLAAGDAESAAAELERLSTAIADYEERQARLIARASGRVDRH